MNTDIYLKLRNEYDKTIKKMNDFPCRTAMTEYAGYLSGILAAKEFLEEREPKLKDIWEE